MNKITGKLIARIDYDAGILSKKDEISWMRVQQRSLLQWGSLTYADLSPAEKVLYDSYRTIELSLTVELETLIRALAISIYMEEGKTLTQAEAAYDTI